MKQNVSSIAFDKEYSQGAYSAINTCLRLQPSEKIVIVTDNFTSEIAASLVAEIEKVGSPCSVFVLEDYTVRPMKHMPQEVLDELETAQVSVFCAQAQTGELGARIEMSSIVNRRKIRHGHMVNINRQIMLEGMRADFNVIDELSTRLITKARAARTIVVKNAAGTNITATFSPKLNWLKTSGIISPDKWGNLPGGEIFTAPENIEGTFVTDGVVGDYLCTKYGILKDTPLYIDIVNNRIKSLRCSNNELLEEFNTYTHTDENSDRVGEFAIGTNIAVKDVIGHILQDEKIPSCHIAFGHPYAEHTGQTWVSTTHIDCVCIEADIWLDGEQVMEKGKFIF
ncbi:MAG: aminopeptidase [Bacteroidota bacterium]